MDTCAAVPLNFAEDDFGNEEYGYLLQEGRKTAIRQITYE